MKENGPPTRFVSIFSLASSTLSLSLSLSLSLFSPSPFPSLSVLTSCTWYMYGTESGFAIAPGRVLLRSTRTMTQEKAGERHNGEEGREEQRNGGRGGGGTGKDIYCIFRRSAEFDKMVKLFYFRGNNI